MKNRWLIIALDGLEYTLVEKFDLKHLKQREYGKVDVSEFLELVTPLIWASFITGQSAEKITRKYLPKWENRFLEKLRWLSIKLKLGRVTGKGRILKLLGFKQRQGISYDNIITRFSESNTRTLFDVVPNSISLSVPPTQKWISEETRFLMEKVVETRNVEPLEKNVWSHFTAKRDIFLKIIKTNNWNLLMCHFMFTDLLGHFWIGHPSKMFKVYAEANMLVKEAKEQIDENTTVLVISDHGMVIPSGKTFFGDHSNYGFYSSNKRLPFKNPKITDFWRVITEE